MVRKQCRKAKRKAERNIKGKAIIAKNSKLTEMIERQKALAKDLEELIHPEDE